MARSQWVPPGKASTCLEFEEMREETGSLYGFICWVLLSLKEAIESMKLLAMLFYLKVV